MHILCTYTYINMHLGALDISGSSRKRLRSSCSNEDTSERQSGCRKVAQPGPSNQGDAHVTYLGVSPTPVYHASS